MDTMVYIYIYMYIYKGICVCVSSARIDHGTYVITIYTKIVGYHVFSNLGILESLILSNFENENTPLDKWQCVKTLYPW